jgi:hypothetical protein
MLLKPEKYKAYFTRRSIYTMIIFCSVLLRVTNISEKFVEKSKHAFHVQERFSENRTVYEVM